MTEALRRVPHTLRVWSVVALAAVLVVGGAVLWRNERAATQENLRLYDLCLSNADDVSQVRACTRDFYVRRDGTPGADPVQVAAESTRIHQLRAAGPVEAVGPTRGPRPDPTADPTDPRPATTAAPVAAVPSASAASPVVPDQPAEATTAGDDGSGEPASPDPEPTTNRDDHSVTDQPASSQRPTTSPAKRPTTDPSPAPSVPVVAEPRPSRTKGGIGAGSDRG